jgi:hypothetical protein
MGYLGDLYPNATNVLSCCSMSKRRARREARCRVAGRRFGLRQVRESRSTTKQEPEGQGAAPATLDSTEGSAAGRDGGPGCCGFGRHGGRSRVHDRRTARGGASPDEPAHDHDEPAHDHGSPRRRREVRYARRTYLYGAAWRHAVRDLAAVLGQRQVLARAVPGQPVQDQRPESDLRGPDGDDSQWPPPCL